MRKLSLSLCVLLIFSVFINVAFALTPSLTTTTAQRDAVANNWSYFDRGYYENNCLAYALGNTTQWIWPWGSSNPMLNEANTYMSNQGYTAVSKDATGPLRTTRAYAFGSTSNVTHFAKNTNSTMTLKN